MRLNTTTESDQLRVTLDELGDGNFVASWVSKHSGDDDVYTQVFGAPYCEGGVPCLETTCDPINAYCDNVDGVAACTCVTGTLNPDTLLCE